MIRQRLSNRKKLTPLFIVLLFVLLVIIVFLVKKLLDNQKSETKSETNSEMSRAVSEYLRSVKTTNTLKQKDLFICGLVRDSSKTVLKNLSALTQIGSVFKSCRFILVENDSKDGTDQLLKDWAKDKQNVFLISKKMDHELNPSLPTLEKGHNYMLSKRRFTKMALLRNMYMKKLEELVNPKVETWVAVVDLDLHTIPVKATLESLSEQTRGNWDAICANGITSICRIEVRGSIGCDFVRKDNGKFGRPYDTLALRLDKSELEQNFSSPEKKSAWIAHHHKVGRRINRAHEPLKVASCFGGLTVYKAEKFKKLRYSGEDCEHISVNRHLDSIEIVPDFNVYYD